MMHILLIIANLVVLNSVPTANYNCGVKHGNSSCANNRCCSSSGFCGSSFAYCGIGCQEKFGHCWWTADQIPETTEFRCGIDFEGQQCPGLLCCSREGYCGQGLQFCGVDCQFQYGNCQDGSDAGKPVPTPVIPKPNKTATTNGSDFEISELKFCGGLFGQCPKGSCCNSQGICGSGDSDCDIQRGCNPGYGSCLPLDYQCGPNFGNQACGVDGWCCSSVGYCGTGPDYCEPINGCVAECTPEGSTSTSTAETSSTTSSEDVTSTSTEETSSTTSSEDVITSTSTEETSTSETTSTSDQTSETTSSETPTSESSSEIPTSTTDSEITSTSSAETSSTSETATSSTSSRRRRTLTRRTTSTESSPTETGTETSSDDSATSTETSTETESPEPSPMPEPDGSCGPDTDNAPCPEGSCCSIWGFCGFSELHCSIDNCLYQCGDSNSTVGVQEIPTDSVSLTSDSFTETSTETSTDPSTESSTETSPAVEPTDITEPGGMCGILSPGALCPQGQCCSEWGWCGVTEEHCITKCASQCKEQQ